MLQTIILATLITGLPAIFAGLLITSKTFSKVSTINYLVAFSAGTLLGGALFHLLPEALEFLEPQQFSVIFVLTIVSILILEKFVHWHHCGFSQNEEHIKEHTNSSVTLLSLIGDTFHNFTDGLIIAAAFIANPSLGVTTTIAVAVHEIPQEVSDFSIMVRGGYSRKKAIYANIVVGLSAVLGGVIGWAFINALDGVKGYLFAIAAGMFTYIALTDLFPEIREEHKPAKFGAYALLAILGLGLMWGLTFFE